MIRFFWDENVDLYSSVQSKDESFAKRVVRNEIRCCDKNIFLATIDRCQKSVVERVARNIWSACDDLYFGLRNVMAAILVFIVKQYIVQKMTFLFMRITTAAAYDPGHSPWPNPRAPSSPSARNFVNP